MDRPARIACDCRNAFPMLAVVIPDPDHTDLLALLLDRTGELYDVRRCRIGLPILRQHLVFTVRNGSEDDVFIPSADIPHLVLQCGEVEAQNRLSGDRRQYPRHVRALPAELVHEHPLFMGVDDEAHGGEDQQKA